MNKKYCNEKISKSDGKACIDISVMDDTMQLGNCYTDNQICAFCSTSYFRWLEL